MTIRVFSFGGGVQSTACLVLAAQRKQSFNYDAFAFSNVGERAENADTLKYVDEYSRPFALRHGINFIDTAWIGAKGPKRGIARDLYDDLLESLTSIHIPMRLIGGGFGNRKCTARYKIEPVAKLVARMGATIDNKATLGLGISVDEWHRAKDSQTAWIINDYPLIRAELTRDDCKQIILDAGLPVPPKSSCWFCPFKHLKEWLEMAINNPALFAKACELEAILNGKRANLGKDPAYFAAGEKPLAEAILLVSNESGFQGCDSGHCWT